jgi:hypothetical protein
MELDGWGAYLAIAAAVSTVFVLMASALQWTVRASRERKANCALSVADSSEEAMRCRYRIRHDVRAIRVLEEGFGLDKLPSGVFGFTFSPSYEDSPLFRERSSHSFEVHKLRDGQKFLLGFVSSADKAKIGHCGSEARSEAHVFLHPHAETNAAEIVCIPVSRVARFKDYRPEKSAGMEIMVVPAELSGRGATPPSFRLDPPLPSAPPAA